MRSWELAILAAALAGVAGCKTGTTDSGVQSTPNDTATPAPSDSGSSGGSGGGSTSGSGGGGAPSVPTLFAKAARLALAG
jgi:hypothetical protein